MRWIAVSCEMTSPRAQPDRTTALCRLTYRPSCDARGQNTIVAARFAWLAFRTEQPRRSVGHVRRGLPVSRAPQSAPIEALCIEADQASRRAPPGRTRAARAREAAGRRASHRRVPVAERGAAAHRVVVLLHARPRRKAAPVRLPGNRNGSQNPVSQRGDSSRKPISTAPSERNLAPSIAIVVLFPEPLRIERALFSGCCVSKREYP